MKKIILLSIYLLFSLLLIGQSRETNTSSSEFKELTVNNVKYFIEDYEDKLERSSGRANWELESYDNLLLFDHGMWLTGKVNSELKTAMREWFYFQYSRGPIIDDQPAMISQPEDSTKYRIYKITENDDATNPDYSEWPVEYGAPTNPDGTPKLFGDQMLWTVYNAYDTNTVIGKYYHMNTDSAKLNYILPIEIREKVYTHQSITENDDDLLSNIIFIEYTFINKGDVQIDSAYWGFWTDIDSDLNRGDWALVDTTKQLGLCYSTDNEKKIPAVGYTMLYGPSVNSIGSTAIIEGKEVVNKRNLNLNTFHPIKDDSFTMFPDVLDSNSREKLNVYGPPYSVNQAWNVSRGLGAFGMPYYNQFEDEFTKFPYSGDPGTDQGWYAYNNNLAAYHPGGGAGFVFFAGPFNMAPADTQWVMLAFMPALGENNFDSITKLRNKADQLRAMPYDSLAISNRVVSSVDEKDVLKLDYALKQNYPNPFNPATRIEYSIPKTHQVKLEIYNVLGEKLVTLFDGVQQAGNQSVTWNAESFSSGIYFYRLSTGSFIQTNKMMLVK